MSTASKATSIRGSTYEENFMSGFLRKNVDKMTDRKFICEGDKVYGLNADGTMNKGKSIGDIDGYYISNTDCKLTDLLPAKKMLTDPTFKINAGDHVFFELTTQSGDVLGVVPHSYITKKVKFHKKLLDGEAFGWKIDGSRHVLVLGFNGADNRAVATAFQTACETHGIRGMSVYMASDVIDQWDLQLQLDKANAMIKSLRMGPPEAMSSDIDDDRSDFTV